MRLDNSGLALGTDYVGTAPPSNGAIIQGNVGIGTTSPTHLLDVDGTGRFTGSLELDSR